LKPIVLDTSAAFACCVPGETSRRAAELARYVAEHGAIVPPLWHVDIANALLYSERNGRISRSELDRQMLEFEAMPISDHSVALSHCMALA
jgi:predicted nucleic acid-binding protein